MCLLVEFILCVIVALIDGVIVALIDGGYHIIDFMIVILFNT